MGAGGALGAKPSLVGMSGPRNFANRRSSNTNAPGLFGPGAPAGPTVTNGLAADAKPVLGASKPVLGGLGNKSPSPEPPAEPPAPAPLDKPVLGAVKPPSAEPATTADPPMPKPRVIRRRSSVDDDAPVGGARRSSFDELPTLGAEPAQIADDRPAFTAADLQAPDFDDEIDDEQLMAEEAAFLARMRGGAPAPAPAAPPAPRPPSPAAPPSRVSPPPQPVSAQPTKSAAPTYRGPTHDDALVDDLSEEELL